MYRYFLVHDNFLPKPKDNYGHWNAIHLSSHGNAGKGWNLLVLHDVHIEPHPQWKAFPRVVDARNPIKARIQHGLLADLNITGDETMLEAADKFAEVFSPFAHP